MDLGGTSAVSVYNSDFHHLLAISEHLSTGLKAHERAIILASAHHIHIIQSILSSLGHSIHHLTIANHLICVDAPAFLHAICDDDPSIMAYLDLNKDGRKGVLERICASISKHFAVPMEPLSLHGLSGKSPSDQPRMRIYAEVGDLFLRACLRSPGGFGWDAVGDFESMFFVEGKDMILTLISGYACGNMKGPSSSKIRASEDYPNGKQQSLQENSDPMDESFFQSGTTENTRKSVLGKRTRGGRVEVGPGAILNPGVLMLSVTSLPQSSSGTSNTKECGSSTSGSRSQDCMVEPLDANEVFQRLLGCPTADELRSGDWIERRVHPEDRDALRCMMFASGARGMLSYRILDPLAVDGDSPWLRVSSETMPLPLQRLAEAIGSAGKKIQDPPALAHHSAFASMDPREAWTVVHVITLEEDENSVIRPPFIPKERRRQHSEMEREASQPPPIPVVTRDSPPPRQMSAEPVRHPMWMVDFLRELIHTDEAWVCAMRDAFHGYQPSPSHDLSGFATHATSQVNISLIAQPTGPGPGYDLPLPLDDDISACGCGMGCASQASDHSYDRADTYDPFLHATQPFSTRIGEGQRRGKRRRSVEPAFDDELQDEVKRKRRQLIGQTRATTRLTPPRASEPRGPVMTSTIGPFRPCDVLGDVEKALLPALRIFGWTLRFEVEWLGDTDRDASAWVAVRDGEPVVGDEDRGALQSFWVKCDRVRLKLALIDAILAVQRSLGNGVDICVKVEGKSSPAADNVSSAHHLYHIANASSPASQTFSPNALENPDTIFLHITITGSRSLPQPKPQIPYVRSPSPTKLPYPVHRHLPSSVDSHDHSRSSSSTSRPPLTTATTASSHPFDEMPPSTSITDAAGIFKPEVNPVKDMTFGLGPRLVAAMGGQVDWCLKTQGVVVEVVVPAVLAKMD